jgi:hypothetical protein
MPYTDGRDANIRRGTDTREDGFDETNAPWVMHDGTHRCENPPRLELNTGRCKGVDSINGEFGED